MGNTCECEKKAKDIELRKKVAYNSLIDSLYNCSVGVAASFIGSIWYFGSTCLKTLIVGTLYSGLSAFMLVFAVSYQYWFSINYEKEKKKQESFCIIL